MSSNKNKMAGNTAKIVIEKIKTIITQRTGGNALRALARVFRNMDNSGDGLLDRDEFRWGLQDFGIHLKDPEFNALFLAFDTDGSGTIQFDEFLTALRGKLSDSRRIWVRRAFEVMDKDHNGSIELNDIKGVYHALGHPQVISGQKTEDEVLIEFLKGFEKYGNQDGIVSWDEFQSYYQDVSNSIDTDDYFVAMMKSAWKLDSARPVSKKATRLDMKK